MKSEALIVSGYVDVVANKENKNQRQNDSDATCWYPSVHQYWTRKMEDNSKERTNGNIREKCNCRSNVQNVWFKEARSAKNVSMKSPLRARGFKYQCLSCELILKFFKIRLTTINGKWEVNGDLGKLVVLKKFETTRAKTTCRVSQARMRVSYSCQTSQFQCVLNRSRFWFFNKNPFYVGWHINSEEYFQEVRLEWNGNQHKRKIFE